MLTLSIPSWFQANLFFKGQAIPEALKELLYANSFACKQSENAINNHFWRRATIRGQHSQLITSRDPFNFRHIISQQAVLLVTFADTLLGYRASIPHRENKLLSTDEHSLQVYTIR